MPEDLPQALLLLDAVAIPLGVALALGGLASEAWLRACASPWRDCVAVQAAGLRCLGFALGLAGLASALWFEAAAMAEQSLLASMPAVATLTMHTHFGHAGLLGLAAWVVAGMLVLLPREARAMGARRAFGLLALALLLLTRSVVSHADARGDASLDVLVDAAHIAFACLWIGVVIAGARLVLPPDGAAPAERADAALWVAGMSRAATISLSGVVVTGVFKAWRVLAPVSSLAQLGASEYARVLAAKLALVALAALLGAANRFVVLPAWSGRGRRRHEPHAARWRHRLVGILRIESATLLLVLAAAAVLGAAEPPGAM